MGHNSKGKPERQEESTRIWKYYRTSSPRNVIWMCKCKGLSFFALLIIYLKHKLFKEKYIIGFNSGRNKYMKIITKKTANKSMVL